MIKVLIADDQKLIRQSLEIVLSSRGNLSVTESVENGTIGLFDPDSEKSGTGAYEI